MRIESGQSLSFNDGTLSGNLGVKGGSILNSGIVTLTNVTLISNNTSIFGVGGIGAGGGIYNAGTITLINVTLTTNDSYSNDGSGQANGGGIYNSGTAMLTNVTLSGNSASVYNGILPPGGTGGGIYNDGTLMLTNATLSGNTTRAFGAGGGIYNHTGTPTLTNTIVANSPSGGNCNESLGGSFNLSNDGTCGFGAGRDTVNVMLGPLANNGGSTLTYMPLGGSPALNFGTNTGCPSTDQRGKPRPVNGICDVGAVERQTIEFSYLLYMPLILK